MWRAYSGGNKCTKTEKQCWGAQNKWANKGNDNGLSIKNYLWELKEKYTLKYYLYLEKFIKIKYFIIKTIEQWSEMLTSFCIWNMYEKYIFHQYSSKT